MSLGVLLLIWLPDSTNSAHKDKQELFQSAVNGFLTLSNEGL